MKEKPGIHHSIWASGSHYIHGLITILMTYSTIPENLVRLGDHIFNSLRIKSKRVSSVSKQEESKLFEDIVVRGWAKWVWKGVFGIDFQSWNE